ncbi:MAG TPA: serine/threonine-protein kinase [Polyangia bacterium]|nr:serine/threonine-protein kinase [Polyangia bacterium]
MERAVLETPSDRYAIRQYLAEGGMGAIYLGKQLSSKGFDKDVVLKHLLPEYTSNQALIDLFLHEFWITASLEHANIVHALDVVKADDDYYIVMEYVEGGDLRMLLRRAKLRGYQFSPEAALYVGRCLLEALAYAYNRRTKDGKSLQLIHRDISPSNILVSGTGDVKLSDFGIAKVAILNSARHRVAGKIGYMSPEQARGEQVDHRSDVFSLAVCLYEALVGERLFVGDPTSSPSMVYSQPVRPPSQVRPGLPRDLDDLLARALAPTPAERYESADEFHDALDLVVYRNNLAYSAREMSAHLREICGEVRHWRSLENDIGQPTGTAVLEGDEAARSGGNTFSGVTFLTGVTNQGERFTQTTGWDTPSWTAGIPAETTQAGEGNGLTLTGDFSPGGEPSVRLGKPLAEGTQLRSILGLAPLGDDAPSLLRTGRSAGPDLTPSPVLGEPTQVSADPLADPPGSQGQLEFDELLLDSQPHDPDGGGLDELTLPQGPQGLATDLLLAAGGEAHDDDAEEHEDETTSTYMSWGTSPREAAEEEIPALDPPPAPKPPVGLDGPMPRTRKADSLRGLRIGDLEMPHPAAASDVQVPRPAAPRPRSGPHLRLLVAIIVLGVAIAILLNYVLM